MQEPGYRLNTGSEFLDYRRVLGWVDTPLFLTCQRPHL